jgi:hypothetical protein
MARRSTRDEAIAAENQAVRLFARGYSDGEIAVALALSESEARRKRLLGRDRRRQEAAETSAWSRLEAELLEAQRVAYRDHDEAPKGSAARVGCIKVIVELSTRRARLYGLDLEQVGQQQGERAPGTSTATPGAPERNNGAELRDACREAEERLRGDARIVLDLERAAGAENVQPPEPEEPSSEGEQPS